MEARGLFVQPVIIRLSLNLEDDFEHQTCSVGLTYCKSRFPMRMDAWHLSEYLDFEGDFEGNSAKQAGITSSAEGAMRDS